MADPELLDVAFRIAAKIEKEKAKNRNIGRGGRPDFNFFVGLTENKVHLEYYHTNFISYLLSAEGHDCGHLFLKRFLKIRWCGKILVSPSNSSTAPGPSSPHCPGISCISIIQQHPPASPTISKPNTPFIPHPL